MQKKWTSFISFVLLIAVLLLPFSATANALTIVNTLTIRQVLQWTPSGWQRVFVTPTATRNISQTALCRVQSGDTLHRLSLRFNTTVTELMRLNRLTGTTIFIQKCRKTPCFSYGDIRHNLVFLIRPLLFCTKPWYN